MVGFPLLLIPLAIYNIIVFLMPTVSFTDPLVKLTLMSGAEWTVTLSDVLLTLSILLLLAEVIKGARPGAKYLTDHLLSLIVFGAAAAEFLLWPKFATSTYFLMTALVLVDFLSGLALRTRRRVATAKAAPVPSPKSAEKVEAPPAEPVRAPAVAPTPAAPAATSVAESVLAATPEPKPADQPKPVVHPEPKPETSAAKPETAIPITPSPAVAPPPEEAPPEISSPRLQPGTGFPPSPDKPDKSQS
ncbi:hypothetical protein [Bradyrhizobium sp.]|uniref:hypothetical protein n=1 Tax=Bradyrhizobium sp. TaxID=376 RepID=UPI002D1FB3F2|nr:hypothetical protein [Bradyrhizobium sp.]